MRTGAVLSVNVDRVQLGGLGWLDCLEVRISTSVAMDGFSVL